MDQWQWTIIANRIGMSFSRLIDFILRKENNHDDDKIKSSRFIFIGESIFKGELKNKKEKYDRNKDSIIFKSQFYGNTESSYFAAEIIPPTQSYFPLNTFHLDETSGNITSFCGATINGEIQNIWNIHNIPTNLGRIHGRDIKTDWFEWSWKIPDSAPKGDYRVIIGMWSGSQDEYGDKSIPIHFYEESFLIMDMDDSP